MNNDPINDPIIEEVRRVRDEHAAQFGYDLHAICEDYRRMQQEQNWQVISLPPVPAKPLPPLRKHRSS